jgi:MoaA/NifB/PqqE/SkfB family radical SAM enzyme
VALAFRDFVATDGDREAMLSKLTTGMGVLLRLFEEWVADGGKSRQLAEGLLSVCTAIDDGKVWHKDLKLRSYTDVSVQVKALRIFVERLSALRGSKGRVDSLNLTALILDHFPTSRAALLVKAELLLERGELDSAVEAIQRVLRVQAVCPTAEQLLMRAYRAKRSAGSKDEALSVLDYDLRDKFCHIPFTYLSTAWKGAAHVCSCPAWVPFPVGNVLSAESVDAVWNSPAAAEVRRSILDGDFSYCSRTLCSFITAQKLPRKDEIEDPTFRRYIDNHLTVLAEPPAVVELNYDATCNLACPSCRTEIVTAKADEQDSYARATDHVILPLLKGAKGAYICGGGEAFASKHFRAILAGLNRREYPSLRLHLITNGLLVTPQRWKDFPELAEMIGAMSVSIDAAKAETYEKLRRPGKWATLMSNLEFIAGMRRAGQIPQLWINFVVQKENYHEMIDFVELGSRLGVDQVWFQRVTNYGAYGEATFAEVDVTSPSHPEHAGLLEILRDPVLRSPIINRQMLMSLLPEVVSSDERLEHLYRSPETLIML